MDTSLTAQHINTKDSYDIFQKFVFKLKEARSGKQNAAAASELFKAGERDNALQALRAVRTMIPIVANLLNDLPAQLDSLQEELEKIESGPDSTPTGLLFDSPIPADAPLSTRARNCLKNGDIKTIRQFCALDLGDLMRFRNMGKVTLNELEAYRSQLGVPFVGL